MKLLSFLSFLFGVFYVSKILQCVWNPLLFTPTMLLGYSVVWMHDLEPMAFWKPCIFIPEYVRVGHLSITPVDQIQFSMWCYTGSGFSVLAGKNKLGSNFGHGAAYAKSKDLAKRSVPDNQETLKYWVGVQRGQSYLTGRRCLFNLRWPPF